MLLSRLDCVCEKTVITGITLNSQRGKMHEWNIFMLSDSLCKMLH